jgi:hypothetical protein
MPAFTPMTWTIRYRLTFAATAMYVESVFGFIGYWCGLVAHSYKEGVRNSRHDFSTRSHAELLWNYRVAKKRSAVAKTPNEPWNVTLNRLVKEYVQRQAAKKAKRTGEKPPGSPLDL